MLKNKTTLKIVFTLFVILIPWAFNFSSNLTDSPPVLDIESVNFYQKNTCELSLLNFLITNNSLENFELRFDSYSDLSCYGKIQYVEPTQNGFVVFVGSHSLISIALQSIIWLTLLSLIKKKNTHNKFFLESLLTSTLFSLNFLGEETLYSNLNLNYSKNITLDNYLLFSYFISFFLICYFISEVCSKRIENLILYFPFLFLINGAYINTNINFFVIVLVFYGFKNILQFKKNVITLNSIYLLVILFWINNDLLTHSYFDVDKLIGFSATTNTSLSLTFWYLTFLLIINGVYYLIDSCKKINLNKIFSNFLNSGFLVVIFGLIASSNLLINKFIYLYFGQNKSSIFQIQSIEGNTWRGFSSSAEMIGEFYGLILLLTFYFLYVKKITLSVNQVVFILFIVYGFFRANNIAALTSLLAIITFVLISMNVQKRKNKAVLYSFLTVILIVSSYFVLRQNTYAAMGQSVVFEGLSISNIEIKDNENFQNVDRLLSERDFLSILDLFKERDEISSSLSYITANLTNQSNISYIPNPVAILSTGALFINRAEKWGTFFAKYDPGVSEFYFGYGPLNLVNYNFDKNIITDGLILPHSSLLSFLIYFGLIGLFTLVTALGVKVFKYRKNNLFINLALVFLLINYLKSDSLLYVSSFVMFLFLYFVIDKDVFYEQ